MARKDMLNTATPQTRTESDIRQFYRTELLPILREFEVRRRVILRRAVLFGAGILGLLAAVLVLSKANYACVAVAVALGLAAFAWSRLVRDYTARFKQEVVTRIIKFCRPTLHYQPERMIPYTEFHESALFVQAADRYSGEDLVTGRIGATAIRFSEVHAEYRTETRDSKGGRHTQWHTIFKGLLVIADFNKNFQGITVVLPDLAENLFGFMGRKLQEWNAARGELIKLEDPDFEKAFVVYGDDQVEARYILSTSLMRRILAYREKTGRKVYLSFAHSSVYVAVATGRDMFEPRFLKTLLDEEMALDRARDVELAAGVVEELNLNTRIWSKQ